MIPAQEETSDIWRPSRHRHWSPARSRRAICLRGIPLAQPFREGRQVPLETGSTLGSVTFAILVISVVAVSGLMIGSIRVRGIGLGPAGVLFSGILVGHFGATIDHDIAVFAKEFGLILFVFTIGLQLGPGIVRLWKQEGLLLNGMAFAIVLQGFVLVAIFTGFNLSPLAAAGVFSGATTNTPSLGAAEQAASLIVASSIMESIEVLTSAYAVTYPGGIVGIITAMLLIRRMFRIDIADETAMFQQRNGKDHEPLSRRSIIVDNPHLQSIEFVRLPGVEETGVRISRIKRAGEEQGSRCDRRVGLTSRRCHPSRGHPGRTRSLHSFGWDHERCGSDAYGWRC